MIRLYAALVCQEHVAHENDGCMGDQSIEIPALNFLGQSQVLFGHLEKYLDVPAFAVNAYDVLIAASVSVDSNASQSFFVGRQLRPQRRIAKKHASKKGKSSTGM